MVLGETHKSAKSVIEAFHGAEIKHSRAGFVKEANGRVRARLRGWGARL